MNNQRILVAGIGNIFLGDNGFGVHVAQMLARRSIRQRARIVDFGIRGLDLVDALCEPWDAVILLDAYQHGEKPGTLCRIEPDITSNSEPYSLHAHGLNPVEAMKSARAAGGILPRVIVVGCQPTPLINQDEFQMKLSPPVYAALRPAVDMVESIVDEILDRIPVAELQHEAPFAFADA